VGDGLRSLASGGGHVPVAVIGRSEVDESVHFGTAVALDAGRTVVYAAGDPDIGIYPRSALKPLQASAMVANGLELPLEQLAVVAASHDGTDRHCDMVRKVLKGAGLSETALRNVASMPYDERTAASFLLAGGGPTPIRMNCSGKHAGMLATCVANGWSTEDYLDCDHPVQRAITAEIDLRALGVAHVGTDGCGAPTHVVGLANLARGFAGLAAEHHAVYAAMTAHPEMLAGANRDVTLLMRGIPGLMVKDGAEGVCVAAFPDGRALAVKIADGAGRAVPVVMLALLERLGVDTSAVPARISHPVLGRGRQIGRLRSVLPDSR
jgi:L-asparaginase II